MFHEPLLVAFWGTALVLAICGSLWDKHRLRQHKRNGPEYSSRYKYFLNPGITAGQKVVVRGTVTAQPDGKYLWVAELIVDGHSTARRYIEPTFRFPGPRICQGYEDTPEAAWNEIQLARDEARSVVRLQQAIITGTQTKDYPI